MPKYLFINIKDIDHYVQFTGHTITKVKDKLYTSGNILISKEELMKVSTEKCSDEGGLLAICDTVFNDIKSFSFRFPYKENPTGSNVNLKQYVIDNKLQAYLSTYESKKLTLEHVCIGVQHLIPVTEQTESDYNRTGHKGHKSLIEPEKPEGPEEPVGPAPKEKEPEKEKEKVPEKEPEKVHKLPEEFLGKVDDSGAGAGAGAGPGPGPGTGAGSGAGSGTQIQGVLDDEERKVFKPKNTPISIMEQFDGLGMMYKPIFNKQEQEKIRILSQFEGLGLRINHPFFTNC